MSTVYNDLYMTLTLLCLFVDLIVVLAFVFTRQGS